MIRFLDLKRTNQLYAVEFIKVATQILNDGWYILGDHVRNFEAELCQYADERFESIAVRTVAPETVSCPTCEKQIAAPDGYPFTSPPSCADCLDLEEEVNVFKARVDTACEEIVERRMSEFDAFIKPFISAIIPRVKEKYEQL